MKFGYARVSTRDQNLDLQIDQLRQAGIVQETASGAKSERPILKSWRNCWALAQLIDDVPCQMLVDFSMSWNGL